MGAAGWIEIALYVALLTAITPVLGRVHDARVPRRDRDRLRRSPHRPDLRRAPSRTGRRTRSRCSSSSAVFFALLYLILRTQGIHPWNPNNFDSMPYDVALNTTSSFVTNTNWQYYAGETTLSNFSQMAGLAVQNFVSAAVGISVAIAFIRALAARSGTTIGNYYSDLIQDARLRAAADLDRGRPRPRLAGRHPVADRRPGGLAGGHQEARDQRRRLLQRQLGASVREPDLALELHRDAADPRDPGRADLRLRPHGRQPPPGLGDLQRDARAVRDRRGRRRASPRTTRRPPWTPPASTASTWRARSSASASRSTALFTVVTTVASCGAVNGAMESLTGIGGLVPMANMQTGEVIFGGVGSGLYGMLMFAILGVFLSGLMVGRTPEFLGKKIEAREIKLTVIGTIGVPMLVLFTSAVAIASELRQGIDLQLRAAGLVRDALRLHVAGQQQRLGVRRLHRLPPAGRRRAVRHHVRQPARRPRDAVRPLPAAARRARDRRLARRQARDARPAPARSAPTRRRSSSCSSASWCSIALLTFVPALLLGPVVQGMTDQLF